MENFKFLSSIINFFPKNCKSPLNQYAHNEYSVKNSVAFVSDLNKVNINAHELYMTSFDVESLYTNVPLVETIAIIIRGVSELRIRIRIRGYPHEF